MPKPRRPARPAIPALEWACDVTGRVARVTAVGNCRVLIENHTGILDFSESAVTLSTASGPLSVHGRGLILSEVRENALMIHGRVGRVEFPQGGDVP